MYDLIIIGGGPAALAAGFYAVGKKLRTVVIYEQLGGKTNWHSLPIGQQAGRSPSPPEYDMLRLLAQRVQRQAELILHDRVQRVALQGNTFLVQTHTQAVLQSRALIVATGADPLRLQVPGADHIRGLTPGYSIATYAHLAEGLRVAVIGDTSRVRRGIAELTRSAGHVWQIIPAGTPDATALSSALRLCDNVDSWERCEVVEIAGEEEGFRIVLSRDGEPVELLVDVIFADLGIVPNSDLVKGIAYIDRDGFIVVDEHNNTTMPGLFAAGDVTTAFAEQVLVAVGDGARAAQSAYDYLLAQWLADELQRKQALPHYSFAPQRF